VTHFLAYVTAGQVSFAHLAAVWSPLVAEDVGHEFFAAVAKASNALKAWRTVACVACHGARVATFELFFAGTFARGHRHSTFNGRIELGDAARAVERLSRNVLARRTEAYVTKFCALMLSTR